MPIVRTYGCGQCGHFLEVTLTMEQVDDPPPECPSCSAQTQQEFRPVAIGGSLIGKATKLAETIAHEDYGVADMQVERREGSVPRVRYNDQGTAMQRAQMSSWGATGAMMENAMQIGRATRMDPKSGGLSGVDMLQRMLKSGEQPDLIEASKRRAMRVW